MPCELGFDFTHPGVVPRVPVVFAHAPQRRSRLQHIPAEILDETVIVLFVEKIHERPTSRVVTAHRIHELDDGRAFRSDGAVHADGGGERALRLATVGYEIEVQQSGPQHLVDTLLGKMDFSGGVQFLPPEAAAFGMTIIERRLPQLQGPFTGNGTVRDADIKHCGLARFQIHRRFLGCEGFRSAAISRIPDPSYMRRSPRIHRESRLQRDWARDS